MFLRHKPARTSRSRSSATPFGVEALEQRLVPYALSGNAWPNPQLVTLSFVPDGTNLGGVTSNLFTTFNARWAQSMWQAQILKAAQLWAQQANLNFTVIADSGADIGSGSYEQGDPTMGDIRIGGYNFGSNALAASYQPPPANNYSIAGDIQFNTGQSFNIGSTYDLFTVATHEIGHALGLLHSTNSYAVMYPYYTSRKTALSCDDIAGIQAIYGTRPQDSFDANGSNGSFTTADNLNSLLDPTSLSAPVNGLDITTTSDLDYYSVTAPSATSGTFTVEVQSAGFSLLAPTLTVYAADQKTVLGFVSGAGQYGTTLTLTLNNVTAGQLFYVKVAGADTSCFGTGAYGLVLNFGSGPLPTLTPRSMEVAAGTTPTSSCGTPIESLAPNTPTGGSGVSNGTTGRSAATTLKMLATDPDEGPYDTYRAANEDINAPSVSAPRGVAPAAAENSVLSVDVRSMQAARGLLPRGMEQATISAPFLAPGLGPVWVVSPAPGPLAPTALGPAVSSAYVSSLSVVRDSCVSPVTEPREQVDGNAGPASDSGQPPQQTAPPTDLGTEEMLEAVCWEEASAACFADPSGPADEFGTPSPPSSEATALSLGLGASMGAAVLLRGPMLPTVRDTVRRKRGQFWQPARDERRQARRYRCLLPSWCRQVGADLEDRRPAVAENLSAGGMALLLPGPVEPGAVLAVELEGAMPAVFRWLLVRVVHVRQQAPGEWLAGCTFDQRLSEDEVRALTGA